MSKYLPLQTASGFCIIEITVPVPPPPPGDTVIISGQVVLMDTLGYRPKLGVVDLMFTGSKGQNDYTTSTDVNGNYSVTVDINWSGSVSSIDNQLYVMFPNTTTINAVSSDLINQNFTIWKPPIGVPMPPFGITETAPTRPNPWTTAVPGYYYIDFFGVGSTDSSNTYGYPGHGRLSMPNIVPAGSYVEIHGEWRYFSDEQFFTCNGTVNQPIFIRGRDESTRGVVTFRPRVQGTYTIFEYLEFADRDGDLSGGIAGKFTFIDEEGSPPIPVACNHIVLRYNEIHGNLLEGGINGGGQYNVVWNNLLHDCGDWENTLGIEDQDVHGITLGDLCHNWWTLDNHFYHFSGDAQQINGTTIDDVTYIYFGRNHAHHNKQSGFGSKKATHIFVSQNYMHDHVPSSSSPGLDSGFQYGPKNIWYLFNVLSNTLRAIQGAASNGENHDGKYFIGNVIYNIHAEDHSYNVDDVYHMGAAITSWEYGNKFFVNNTIFDTDGGIGFDGDQTLEIENNIFANMRTGEHTASIESHISSLASTYKNNLIQGYFSIRWADQFTHTVYTTISAFQSGESKGQGCITASANFVDSSTFDFHLLPGSSAIDAGTEHSVYQDFFNLYGINIALDFDGRPRPVNNVWDIGAFESA